MELRNGFRMRIFAGVGVVLTVILACGTLNASLLYIEDIQLNLVNPTFYQGGSPLGSFQLNSVDITAGTGLIRLSGTAGWDDYGITGTITVTSSALLSDNSGGGLASGDFAGGSTLRINGDLVDLSDSSVKFTGLLLEADMDAGTWVLEEWSTQNVSGNTNFTLTDGKLYTGVDVGGGDTLFINDFQAAFSFITGIGDFIGVDPANFGETSYDGFISNVQIVSVPEPCTLMLFSLAGIAVLRRSKRK